MPIWHGDRLAHFGIGFQQGGKVGGVFFQIGVDRHQLALFRVVRNVGGAQAGFEDHIGQRVGGKQQPQPLGGLTRRRGLEFKGDVGQLFHHVPHGQIVKIAFGVGAGRRKGGQGEGLVHAGIPCVRRLGKGRAGQEQRECEQCSQDLFHENFLLFYISGHRPVGCEVRDQPFTEPTITPFSKKRCKKGYSTIMGRVETMISAYLMVSASITRLPRVSTSPSMSCEAVF